MRQPPDGPHHDSLDGSDDRDDRELLRAHVAGDASAFGTLFTRHRDRLWAVALRTTGDPEEAADALQDALVAAFRRAESYRGEAAVTTWLHRVVVNACLDRLRRSTVRRADPLTDPDAHGAPDGELAGSPPGHPVGAGGSGSAEVVDPDTVALDHERRTAVLDALRSLPPEQRAAVVLVDMEGYSVQETAAILDCAPGTVKSRCSRGRARLLPLLVEHGPTSPGSSRSGGRRSAGSEARNPTTRPDVQPIEDQDREVPNRDS